MWAVPISLCAYPSSIHILQHVAKWILIINCSKDLNQCNPPLLLNFQAHSVDPCWKCKGSPAHGGWHWTARFGRTNPKELGWNQICFTGRGLASTMFSLRYTCHQHINAADRFSNANKSHGTLFGLQNVWLEAFASKAELLRHTQQRLTTEVERW